MRVFLGWLRGERGHCGMVAIPTMEEEDARRPNRERESLAADTVTRPARALVTPKDTGRTSAGLGHISHDADTCAGVIPKHGGKPGGGGYADYADSALAADTVTARALMTPKDTGRTIAGVGHISPDADACAGVVPQHGSKPGAGRCAEYANCTLAPDASPPVAVDGSADYAEYTHTFDTVEPLAEYASSTTLTFDTEVRI
jgi:hypothetical protein